MLHTILEYWFKSFIFCKWCPQILVTLFLSVLEQGCQSAGLKLSISRSKVDNRDQANLIHAHLRTSQGDTRDLESDFLISVETKLVYKSHKTNRITTNRENKRTLEQVRRKSLVARTVVPIFRQFGLTPLKSAAMLENSPRPAVMATRQSLV